MKPFALIPLAAATLALAACSGSSGDDGAPAAKSGEDAELAFARCMREEGIDFPDPGPAGSGPREVRIAGDVAPRKLQEATGRCRKKTGGGPKPLGEADQTRFRDAALKFARCMRASGVDVPDPATGPGEAGGILVGPGRAAGGGADPRSPGFRQAEKKCRRFLPGGPGAQVREG